MSALDSIILNLYNLSPSKLKTYSMFLDGFLVEVEENKILKWNLKESAELFSKDNKVMFINIKDKSKLKYYAYIPYEKLDEFLNIFGNPTFKIINFFSDINYKPKISYIYIYLLIIAYYLILPLMMFVVFLKVIFKDNKGKLLFNYYHTVNISEEIYNRILKSHYPMGFNLQGRKDIIKSTINNIQGINESPWLDLGCGLKSLLLEAEEDKGAEIYLLDPNPLAEQAYNMYKDNYKNTKIKFINGCGEKLPFNDNYFSFIYCGGVIGHICYLNKFLLECKRVLKPGGVILFDESNECPRKKFINTRFSIKLNKKIIENTRISEQYAFNPPKNYVSNPWAYWGCSTDHFWIFNLNGLLNHLNKFFYIKNKGSIGSYLCNNGSCESFPLFYSLDLGTFTNIYLDFKNLPKWYLRLINNIFRDTGIYIYSLCEK